jgi:hypothetical protein
MSQITNDVNIEPQGQNECNGFSLNKNHLILISDEVQSKKKQKSASVNYLT